MKAKADDDHEGDQVRARRSSRSRTTRPTSLAKTPVSEHPDHAADPVAGEDVERVVERATSSFQWTASCWRCWPAEPDGTLCRTVTKPGGGGDRDQADHRADAGAHGRGLACPAPCPRTSSPAWPPPTQCWSSRTPARQHRGRQRRAGVEAEPAEPEHARAEQHVRDVGRLMRLVGDVALPPAQHEGARQRGEARRHVDDGAAGEVQHAHSAAGALRVPRHVCQGRVDDQTLKSTMKSR
jgi:hypothetical protein